MPQTNTYNPEIYLESLVRCLNEYASDGFNDAIKDQAGISGGLQLHNVIMEFPGTDVISVKIPLEKTIVHFEIDDIDDRVVGLGDNVFANNYDPVEETVNPQEAGMHMVNFDIGIWSSDRSGGVTARLRAVQILKLLFSGAMAQNRIAEATNGGNGKLEILSYSGGNFATERINDMDVYRMVGGELIIRVFSRTPISSVPLPSIEGITQASGLTILG